MGIVDVSSINLQGTVAVFKALLVRSKRCSRRVCLFMKELIDNDDDDEDKIESSKGERLP
jgi:hypothetical protein